MPGWSSFSSAAPCRFSFFREHATLTTTTASTRSTVLAAGTHHGTHDKTSSHAIIAHVNDAVSQLHVLSTMSFECDTNSTCRNPRMDRSTLRPELSSEDTLSRPTCFSSGVRASGDGAGSKWFLSSRDHTEAVKELGESGKHVESLRLRLNSEGLPGRSCKLCKPKPEKKGGSARTRAVLTYRQSIAEHGSSMRLA